MDYSLSLNSTNLAAQTALTYLVNASDVTKSVDITELLGPSFLK